MALGAPLLATFLGLLPFTWNLKLGTFSLTTRQPDNRLIENVPSPDQVLIIIPAYNEEACMAGTIADIRRHFPSGDILVVDDGSSDGTARIARSAGVEVVVLPFNLGIGGAVQTGLMAARKRGYARAVQVDADGQHDAVYIKDLLSVCHEGSADLVIGSRFLEKGWGYRSSWIRRAGIRFFSWLISALTGCPITDPTSGFRAFGSRAIRLFSESYPVDFPEPESIVTARRHGLRVIEVPVQMRGRVHGHSSIRYFKTAYYMIKVTLAILLQNLKKPSSQDGVS